MMDYFLRKYCSADRVLKIKEEAALIRINQKKFKFKDFAENIGRNVHKESYDENTYLEYILPFEGNGELLFVKPAGYDTQIKFSVVSDPQPSFISVQKRLPELDEKLIIEQCASDTATIKELAEHINKEYLEMNKQFANGVFRLAHHPTRIFSTKRAALDYCYSYLLFNPLLNKIFNLTS
ncbi:MAG: hypothetical protein LBE49_01270 [Deltaproteobacteria bacterium]|nr:hypothetical protein [Deltaproteobacteria bacterium]